MSLSIDEDKILLILDLDETLIHSLERTLIVDDTPHKLIENYGNAIYIKEFNGEKDDEELLFLLNYLQTINECPNVLKIEKRNWRKSNLM